MAQLIMIVVGPASGDVLKEWEAELAIGWRVVDRLALLGCSPVRALAWRRLSGRWRHTGLSAFMIGLVVLESPWGLSTEEVGINGRHH